VHPGLKTMVESLFPFLAAKAERAWFDTLDM